MGKIKLAFLLTFIVFGLSIYVGQAVNSEGIGIISDWGEIISGIDFENDKFIYSDELGKRMEIIGDKVSLEIRPFFPHLKLNLLGKEFTLSWIFYYTPFVYLFVKWILSSFERFDFVLYYKIFNQPLYLVFFSITSNAILLIILVYAAHFILSEKFYDIQGAVLRWILFLVSTSSFFSLFIQMHQLQCTAFFLAFIYLLRMRRDILSGIFGGLTLYSYLPSSFAVAGALIYDFLRSRNLRSLLKKLSVILIFVFPYLINFYLAMKVDFKEVYRCSDCIIYDINKNLRYIYVGKGSVVENLQLLIGSITRLPDELKSALNDIKESFSMSDVYIRYGMIYRFPPLKKLADIFILLHLIVLCYGFLFLHRKDRRDVWLYFFCIMVYTIFSAFFIYVPKMLYILVPLYSIVAVKVSFEFQRFSPTLNKIFIISALLRFTDLVGLPDEYVPYFTVSEANKVIEFVAKNIDENDVAQYCMPLPFKLYSHPKYNPKVISLFFHQWLSQEERERISRFLVRKYRYLIIDARTENEFIRYAELEDYKMRILFKSQMYEVVEFIKTSEHSMSTQ